MANQQHVDILLHGGVKAWNQWRDVSDPSDPCDQGAALDLSEANLRNVDLRGANLSMANLRQADLLGANLLGASLYGSVLAAADLRLTTLCGANLSYTNLIRANLSGANLSGAEFNAADLSDSNLLGAKLQNVNLRGVNLRGANLSGVDLSGVDLSGANLSGANLNGADLYEANLTDCIIYGIAAWDVNAQGAIQKNLRITPSWSKPAITVDNLEVAQFLYLLLHNEKARAVLDTITSKVVLILGRFGEHKVYLDALREALRNHPNGYIPVLFDFDPQADKPILETVKILAHLARFIIADLTDPHMVRAELTTIVPNVPTVPVQPIVEGDAELPTEYASWTLYASFLPVVRYADLDDLIANLIPSVIVTVEQHVHAQRLSDVDAN